MVESTAKQTKPVAVEAVQYLGGSKNAKEVVDWVRANGGEASWRASYEFDTNADGTGQSGWAEILYVVGNKEHKQVAINDWVVMTETGKFDPISPGVFEEAFDDPDPKPSP
jgi:hypothetical protein